MIVLYLYFVGHCDQTKLNYSNMTILWILGGALAGAASIGITIATGGIALPLVPGMIGGVVVSGAYTAVSGQIRAEVNVPLPRK